MFGWRRRNEGFEWREYVRTTVLVRRADRQRRVDDARNAAVEKVKNARDIGVDIGKAGASYAGEKASGAAGAVGDIFLALAWAIFEFMLRWFKFFGAILIDALRAVANPLVEAAAAIAKSIRAKTPELVSRIPVRWKHVGYAIGALAVIYFGGPILRSADGTPVSNYVSAPTITGSIQTSTSSAPTQETESDLRGRAKVVAADLIRVEGTLVHLAGIEAPEAEQPCFKSSGKRLKCAAAAKSALVSMLRGRVVSCKATKEDDAGNLFAECKVDGADISTELVRTGYAFAANDSFFGGLSSEEKTARNEKAGLWQGEVERPAEWRDKAWAEAKGGAPDGCPIKGTLRSGRKTYSLPWSADYARARVRSERGERWFCSEDEARAAGFAPSDRS